MVVTADHAHQPDHPGGVKAPWALLRAADKDGSPIRVAYGTAAGASQQHTGSEVRIAAKGPQATNVLGITEETDTFDTLLGRHQKTGRCRSAPAERGG